jgi:hypothetical protein
VLLIGMCQHDCVIEGGGALECDIRMQGVAQADEEEFNLMGLRDHGVVAGQHHEPFGEVIDGPSRQRSGSSPMGLCERRTEALVHHGHETWPRGRTSVQLQPVVP